VTPLFKSLALPGSDQDDATGRRMPEGPSRESGARKIACWKAAAKARGVSPASSAWLDALRAFLLAEVVLGHLAAIALPELPVVAERRDGFAAFVLIFRLTTRFGPQAAYLFVFLSGFFVGGPLLAAALRGEAARFPDFARRRIARIAPALWIALAIGATFDLIGVHGLGAGEIYERQKAYDFLHAMTATNFVGNLLCLQPTFVGVFGSNGPLWTLGYIVQFYFAGLLVSRALARPALFPVALLGCALVAGVVLRPEWAALFAIWWLGALVRNVSPGASAERWGLAAGFILFVAANRAPPLASILLCGAAGVLLLSWASARTAGPPQLLTRVARAAAELSYEGYMTHYPAAFFIYVAFFGEIAGDMATFLRFLSATLLTVALLSVATQRAARATSRIFASAL